MLKHTIKFTGGGGGYLNNIKLSFSSKPYIYL